MILRATGIMALLCAAFLALLLIGPKRGATKLPLSERGCLILLKLAAWLEHVGTAWDCAILRYRIEKADTYIEMASTAEREGRPA
jgi:hypothetical protein